MTKGAPQSFVSTLWDACQSLAGHAAALPIDSATRGSRHPAADHNGNYLIFYITNGDDVTIIHVLHGARDYEQLLFPCD